MFAEKLCQLVKGISESVPIKTLSFVSDACQLLVQCHKVATQCNLLGGGGGGGGMTYSMQLTVVNFMVACGLSRTG